MGEHTDETSGNVPTAEEILAAEGITAADAAADAALDGVAAVDAKLDELAHPPDPEPPADIVPERHPSADIPVPEETLAAAEKRTYRLENDVAWSPPGFSNGYTLLRAGGEHALTAAEAESMAAQGAKLLPVGLSKAEKLGLLQRVTKAVKAGDPLTEADAAILPLLAK